MASTATLVSPLVAAWATELRREIHRHPELGFEEVRTAALIERELDALGIEHRRLATTGVVGVVRGAGNGPVAGLRADMDALPLTERSGESFSSEVSGKMHACGHDAHTAMLLGAARVLQEVRAELGGDVVLLFQPAEEGPGGALPMIEAGAMNDPRIDAVAMLHVDSRLATGTIGFSPGRGQRGGRRVSHRDRGQGRTRRLAAHRRRYDPLRGGGGLALQNLAARETDPLETVVVTIGTIEGGYRNNIIADSVRLTGTFRSQNPAVRAGLEPRARRILEGIASAYGTRAELKVIYGYPPVVNDAALAETFRAYLSRTVPALPVAAPPPTMGGEDFAYFAERAPGLMIRLGIRNDAAGSIHPGHSPQFRIDEDAIPVGIETLVAFARAVGAGEAAGS
jgi:amidohydrolase